ncbi:MAG: TIGR03086 family metal-binding protein [Streptosporangiaceae bacterium]
MTADIRDLDARAVRASVDVVDGITPLDLSRPTPCSEWTLGDLLAHMTVQHKGFAAASAGHGADLAVWKVGAPSPDPVADYALAAELVIAAFAKPGVLERGFAIPEIMPGMEFPASQAISFHFIDYVVHGWDVARSLGEAYKLDDDLVQAAVPVAEAVPEGERRLRPGAAFRPGLPVLDGASPMDRLLAMLGRDSAWTQPQ